MAIASHCAWTGAVRHERLELSGKSCPQVSKNNRSESHSVHAGSYDHFLNFQIGFIIILQLAMCVFCAVAAYIWRNHSGWPRYQLAMYAYVEGNYENGAAYTFILFITFWILYSYLVPISLFVTMEIVKFWQVLFFLHMSLSATVCAAGLLGAVILCLNYWPGGCPIIQRSASPGEHLCLELFATYQVDLIRSLGLGGTSSRSSRPATADV